MGESDDGNIDDPQSRWLEAQLDAADSAGKLVVVFGHHPIRTLTANVPDEAASPCTTEDSHGHDVSPGCDLDPRPSAPLHLGDDLVQLLSAHPRVVVYVAGHTHENEIRPCGRTAAEGGCPPGGNWWEINTSATADWPQQHRLIELMDNRDGTLSIFATVLDHGAKESIPPSGSSTFSDEELASIGRNFSWNDPQSQRFAGTEGEVGDRNVGLLVGDPRR